ncbi:MAG: hypothetical protein NTZ24_08425 [Deltaproteobacteria bacterium]|nr:hypothetical protein [Deltaproteobacteria bacterium]
MISVRRTGHTDAAGFTKIIAGLIINAHIADITHDIFEQANMAITMPALKNMGEPVSIIHV